MDRRREIELVGHEKQPVQQRNLESFVDVFTVLLAVVTFGLFLRGVHAAYLIDGGAIGLAWFFLVPWRHTKA